MKRFLLSTLVLTGLMTVPFAAKADTIKFEFVGTDPGGPHDISFSLPSPTTGDSCTTSNYVCFASVPTDFNGTINDVQINFYTTAAGGAFDPFSNGSTPALFIGMPADNTLGSVTFKTGTFNVTEDGNGIDYPFVLTVTDTSPVPEPSSLALLGTGLLGAFGMARRRFNA